MGNDLTKAWPRTEQYSFQRNDVKATLFDLYGKFDGSFEKRF